MIDRQLTNKRGPTSKHGTETKMILEAHNMADGSKKKQTKEP